MFDFNIRTFITFASNAYEACKFYETVFRETVLKDITYNDDNTILNGTLSILDADFIVMDLPLEYHEPFSSSISLLYKCESKKEYDDIFAKLSDGGVIMMNEDDFKAKDFVFKSCCWVTDKYGITWQLIFI